MKPPRTPDGDKPLAIKDHLDKVNKVLSNISFGTSFNTDPAFRQRQGDQNISCHKASGGAVSGDNGTTPVAPNTDFTITHTLGRVPITIAGQDTANGGLIYRSPVTAWTSTTVTLRCTTASAVYRIVLI